MQKVYLCRHGETAWNVSGQHTSFTDVCLTDIGKKQAILLGKKISSKKFEYIFTSPLKRACETCHLAGFTGKLWNDLKEWNYGDYEGKKTDEIQEQIPDWSIFKYGAKNGESIEEINKRGKKVLEKIKKLKADTIIFSHGHFTRVLCSLWIGLNASEGRCFATSNASISILGFERENSVIRVLNDTSHLEPLHD